MRRVSQALARMVHGEAGSGIVLMMAAAAALLLANSPFALFHWKIWHNTVTVDIGLFAVSQDLQHWVNDGLMTMFFLLVGVEIKREMSYGALSTWRAATLPIMAAIGGMIAPALFYSLWNAGRPGESGWGIPMATDIAFAVGVIALLGNRVSPALRLMMLALATVDDIGAILVIAVFYTENISGMALGIAAGLLLLFAWLRRTGTVGRAGLIVIGVLFWLAMLESGVHATLSGVLLGLVTPARARMTPHATAEFSDAILRELRSALARNDSAAALSLTEELRQIARATAPPVWRLEHDLHPWVVYLVLPLFALANAGVKITPESLRGMITDPVAIGIAAGLILGKFVGIFTFSWIAVKARLSVLPPGVRWGDVAGISLLGGIGFTVSLFIANLAFQDEHLINAAKLSILISSVVAGLAGYLILRSRAPVRVTEEEVIAAAGD